MHQDPQMGVFRVPVGSGSRPPRSAHSVRAGASEGNASASGAKLSHSDTLASLEGRPAARVAPASREGRPGSASDPPHLEQRRHPPGTPSARRPPGRRPRARRRCEEVTITTRARHTPPAGRAGAGAPRRSRRPIRDGRRRRAGVLGVRLDGLPAALCHLAHAAPANWHEPAPAGPAGPGTAGAGAGELTVELPARMHEERQRARPTSSGVREPSSSRTQGAAIAAHWGDRGQRGAKRSQPA
jgi:hypothetical protein